LVLCLSLHVCVAGSLQQRLHHVSMPLLSRQVQRCVSILLSMQKETSIRPYVHTLTHSHTHTHTHTLTSLSLSLSLSQTHTHTHTHTYAQAHTRKPKYAENMSSRQKTHQASYTCRLRPQTLVA
jgi:hypothetical protein